MRPPSHPPGPVSICGADARCVGSFRVPPACQSEPVRSASGRCDGAGCAPAWRGGYASTSTARPVISPHGSRWACSRWSSRSSRSCCRCRGRRRAATVRPFVDALFTATSASTVTGSSSCRPAPTGRLPGLVVILVAIQVGGLGVMTLASLLGMAVSRRIGLTQRLLVSSETKETRLGEVGSLIRTVIITSLTLEAFIARRPVPAVPHLRRVRSARPRGTRCSTRSRRSTTPASSRRPTAWTRSSPTGGSCCRSSSACSSARSASP